MWRTRRTSCPTVWLSFVVILWLHAMPTAMGANDNSTGAGKGDLSSSHTPAFDPNTAQAYIIITTSDIQMTSTKLADFVAHKQSVGFDVQVITEADFGGGTGDEAAERIRAWLQSHYISENIEYVLLVGDPRPDIGEIPMKLLRPAGTGVPSDVYYADLTGNWDLDGDGRYGEWGDDFGSGGIDRHWEVLIGRIPCYKAEAGRLPYAESVKDLDNILEKTIDYEEQTISGQSLEWRKNTLLAMNGGTGSCLFSESIKDDILIPAEWNYYRVYYKNCLVDCSPEPPPERVLPDSDLSCYDGSIPQIWGDRKFGLVVWAADGDPCWAGCIIHTQQVLRLNNEYPSFTFQVSCDAGMPEDPNNLAYALLKHGAVCTVAPTRFAWSSLPYQFSATGMAYEYTSRIVAGLTNGEALYASKEKITLPQQAGVGAYWPNLLNFNIYGDPSLRLTPFQSRTIYVDGSANGANDGSNWSDAYKHLQDALAGALPGDEIRIARGTYKPDQGIGINLGDPEASFHLKNGVVIKGGYAGFDAPDPTLRDIKSFETILSGDIGRSVNSDSYHVIRVDAGVCEATILDGVTIRGGYARESQANGGGMYIDRSHPKLVDCNFVANTATGWGGGIYNDRGNPILTRCTFSNNSGSAGGGIYNDYASPVLSHTKFFKNSATNGGGIYSFYSNLTLTNCVISGNSAQQYGGGLHNGASNSILTNCTISGNSAAWGGGAGVYNNSCRPHLANCIVWGNRPQQISDYNGGPALITYSDIEGGWPGETNISSDPCFVNPGYWDNNGTPNDPGDDFWIDGDYHLRSHTGRWDPIDETWEKDEAHSPCIDKGDPRSPVGDEPAPNGGQINMGAYGGTGEASKSP